MSVNVPTRLFLFPDQETFIHLTNKVEERNGKEEKRIAYNFKWVECLRERNDELGHLSQIVFYDTFSFVSFSIMESFFLSISVRVYEALSYQLHRNSNQARKGKYNT